MKKDKKQEMTNKNQPTYQEFQVLHYHPKPVCIMDRQGHVIFQNRKAGDLFNHDEKDHIFFRLMQWMEEKEREAFNRWLNKRIFEEGETYIGSLNLEDAESYDQLYVVPMESDIGVITFYCVFQKKEWITSSPYPLEILGRLPFIERLENVLKANQQKETKAALLLIDLDRFKMVNDTLGHKIGDLALQIIVRRIQASLTKGDSFARMDGDEFAILIPLFTTEIEVENKAKKILKEIKKPLEIDGYEFVLTASIGIAYFPENGFTTEALLKAADAAMYRAKVSSAEKYEVYITEMNRSLKEWFQVENDLRKALNRNEFELFYQPQCYTSSKQIGGIEVLVRWNHPLHGVIPPNRFITIAEETGLILPIGEWVLMNACKQMKHWYEQGILQAPMSINVSLRQFKHKGFVSMIEKVLRETMLPPNLLDLEITETVTVDLNRTKSILYQLKALGIRISLDDFGTGYSSLQYISELPIDELKIDQSFVRKLFTKNNSEGIISMIIQLGHHLNLDVIAEGVENEKQFNFLKEQGCQKIQGFYYSEPLSAAELESYHLRA